MPKLVQIAVPAPTENLFTYRVDDEQYGADLTGRRALVPFGKRVLTGIIVSDEAVERKNVRDVIEILDPEPVFSANLLEFTKWLADYYMASWGDVLKAALPAGMSPGSKLRIHIMQEIDEEDIESMRKSAPKRAELLKALMGETGAVTVRKLENALNSENISAQLQALEKMGYIEMERYVDKDLSPKYQKAVKINQNILSDGDKFREAMDKLDKSAPVQSMMLSRLYLREQQSDKPILIADLLKETGGSHSSVNSLAEKNYVEIYHTEIDRTYSFYAGKDLSRIDESSLELTYEQKDATDKLTAGMDSGEFRTFLLHGVTGSGKTLVYMHAIRRAIDAGKTAIILVPEISLTPQLIDRFERVFPEQVAALHSRMSEGERYDSWRSVQECRKKIVLGARSGVFAPVENLGVIIVDEENDFSYKQDSSPRYQARDCAVARGQIEGCAVLLGSATPSIESMYNAKTGKYELLKIMKRADEAEMPEIKVVNMLETRKANRVFGNYSFELIHAIHDRIDKKEGTILLHNRRGFASFLECGECGHIPMCQNCDVALTFHKKKNLLRCHYCGYSEIAERACTDCGNVSMRELGSGTQRIEEELEDALKKFNYEGKIQRMDLDTTSRKGAHRKILEEFAEGKTDILAGTQMVAKGFDFAHVTLVGIVNADLQLYFQDFRSAERTFQIITQASGRAGRTKEKKGEVIIQTSHPDNSSIVAAVHGDYENFYESELRDRAEALYPPYSRFVVIEISSKFFEKADEHTRLLNKFIPISGYYHKLGPVMPVIPRLRSRHRRLIVLKNIRKRDPSGKAMRTLLRKALNEYKSKHGTSAVRVITDVDSYSIM